MKESGQAIRELLKDKSLKPRDVEWRSRSISRAKERTEFYISHASLASIEAGSVPSIYKIYSLAVCCGVSLGEMVSLFGVDAQETKANPQLTTQCNTPLVPPPVLGSVLRFLMNFDVRSSLAETTLLNDQPPDLRLPVDLVNHLESGRFAYARVGLDDDSMAEIIPPGSLVEVDKEQTQVIHGDWRSMRERPIYLVWHEYGYSCSWCQLTRNELLLIPHPVSQRRVSRFRTPSEATVIGRVVHTWHSFSGPQDNSVPKNPERFPLCGPRF